MAISAFKTCEVWFSLDPSMCHSCFYRISGSSICFPLIFSFCLNFLIISSFYCVPFFFSRCLLHNPSSPFIVEFSGRLGEPLVPLFWSFANRVCSVLIISVSPLFRFLSFFPSLGSDSFESFWLAILFGTCWGMPFSASSLLASFTFPFLSYLGGILFCSFEIAFVNILLPCFGSPTPFLFVPWRVACVLLFFSCFSFYRSVLVFFFFALIDGARGSSRLVFCCDVLSFFFFGRFFLFWASGSSGPFV